MVFSAPVYGVRCFSFKSGDGDGGSKSFKMRVLTSYSGWSVAYESGWGMALGR
jgi:hypothetical protein